MFIDGIAGSIAQRSLRECMAAIRWRGPSRTMAAAFFFGVVASAVRFLAEPGKLVRYHPVGGMDLARCCRSYGLPSNDTERCSWKVPSLSEVCNWEKGRRDLHIEIEKGSPYSGECVDRRGGNHGAIDDMTGSCRQRFGKVNGVTADVPNGRDRMCLLGINKDLACSLQYDLAVQQGGLEGTPRERPVAVPRVGGPPGVAARRP